MWAYFPRAKHSSFTVDPLATWTNSRNWTSIFGSYSPITPGREIQMNTIIHAIRGGKSSIFMQRVRLNKCRNVFLPPIQSFLLWVEMVCDAEWGKIKKLNPKLKCFQWSCNTPGCWCWGKYFENPWKVWAFTSRWVSSCRGDNSYEPEK